MEEEEEKRLRTHADFQYNNMVKAGLLKPHDKKADTKANEKAEE